MFNNVPETYQDTLIIKEMIAKKKAAKYASQKQTIINDPPITKTKVMEKTIDCSPTSADLDRTPFFMVCIVMVIIGIAIAYIFAPPSDNSYVERCIITNNGSQLCGPDANAN